MADPFAGIVKLPHKLNCAVGRCRSTVTLSMLRGTPVGLSMRMAPAPEGVPVPMKTTFGEFSQGVGKLRVDDELSAYPTEILAGARVVVPGVDVTVKLAPLLRI
jgi:hypothetical protein